MTNNEPTPSDLRKEAVEFDKWKVDNCWRMMQNYQYYNYDNGNIIDFTELYDIFKAEKK